jgi:hypothetical protein
MRHKRRYLAVLLTAALLLAGASAATSADLYARFLLDGNANDSVGTRVLTTTGNVTYVTTGLPAGLTGAAQVSDNPDDNTNAKSSLISSGANAFNNANINFNNFGISFWFNQNAAMTNGYNTLVGLASINKAAIEFQTSGTNSTSITPRLSLDTEGHGAPSTGATFSNNTWHNVVITGTTSGISCYIDGVLTSVADAALPSDPNFTELYLFRGGYYGSGNVRGWNGELADIQIYNSSLTESDAQFLTMNAGSIIPEPSTYAFLGLAGIALASIMLNRRRRT